MSLATLKDTLAPGDTIEVEGLTFHPSDTNILSHGVADAMVRVRGGKTVRFDEAQRENDTFVHVASVTAKNAAEGKLIHKGIVLEADYECIYLAATCTFGGSTWLRYKTASVVDATSLPNFIPVRPAEKEEEEVDGNTYKTRDPISKIGGNPNRCVWVYVRWASKIYYSDALKVRISKEKYSAEMVDVIRDEIERHRHMESNGSGEL
ncbi:hypothetical protein GSI_02129 [Ganoderma sinense ZZ0214-1]|uniref:Uncharacterized protein n=1 Tax=Ganoderma sinense ZZ0214-1 TaxID=1077348 RepID=A0A2G8SNV3_9APHY|nr:hypothetical protein GSI_02129 [Ganoderma sinense ZZ0214-1]